MIRNDYRRALIMLRGLEKGYSGHMRLERRTLRGSMQFSITAPNGGELRAAIIARKPGTYAAEDLGALGRDGRGQAGLNATIDPRNILGNDLDECPLVAVALVAPPEVRVVLTGNLNGSCEIDWARLKDAVSQLYAGSASSPQPNVSRTGTVAQSVAEEAPSSLEADAKTAAEEAPAQETVPESTSQATQEEAAQPNAELQGTMPVPEADALEDTTPSVPQAETEPIVSAPQENAAQDLPASDGQAAATGPYVCPPTCEQQESAAQEAASSAVRIEVRTLAVPLTEAERQSLQKNAAEAPEEAQPAPVPTGELAVPLEEGDADFAEQENDLTAEEQMAAGLWSTSPAEEELPAAEEVPAADGAGANGMALDPADSNGEDGYGPYPEELYLNSIEGMQEAADGDKSVVDGPSLNFDATWPELAADLKTLFWEGERIQPFDAEGFLFVRAPLPPESGYADCAVGVKPEGGIPAVIVYALKGAPATEPPPGLEGYVWREGENAGYWTTWIDAQTGEQMDMDGA